MSEADDLLAQSLAKLSAADSVERQTDAWSNNPEADLRRLEERSRKAHGLRMEASVLAAKALMLDRPETPKTIPCKACHGSGKADPASRVYQGLFACDGCKGAGVHLL